MVVSVERPSARELEQLSILLEREPLDRQRIVTHLRRIEGELRERRRELDRDGGLLDADVQADRMSLTREDDRLLEQLSSLADDVQWAKIEAEGSAADVQVRDRVRDLIAQMHDHRDSEAKLVIESSTEVGTGD